MLYNNTKHGIITLCVLLAVAAVFFTSCGAAEALSGFGAAKESAKSAAKMMPEEQVYGEEYEPAVEEGLLDKADAPRDISTAGGEAAGSAVPEKTSSSVPDREESERKRVYTGFAELLVDDVERTKMAVTDIADGSGGYVESILEDTITIRVPAERFDAVFKEVRSIGDVLDAYEETVDVTEFYSDLEARLEIATETRARLYDLLERTEDVEERIKILQEIRRLSEEIERINLTFEVLKEHISFSRITLRLVSRLDYAAGPREEVPFPWVDDLHPLYPAAKRFNGSVKGELPDMFALFKKDKYYHAETAEGIRLRISTIANKPRGDAGFWQQALEYHLSPRFAKTVPEEYGGISGVVLTSKDVKPYIYIVGVKPDGRKLHIIEVFFPSAGLYSDHYEAVAESLREITVK